MSNPIIEDLADRLAAMPGVTAVVLGGSRATGPGDAHSDWDLAWRTCRLASAPFRAGRAR